MAMAGFVCNMVGMGRVVVTTDLVFATGVMVARMVRRGVAMAYFGHRCDGPPTMVRSIYTVRLAKKTGVVSST